MNGSLPLAAVITNIRRLTCDTTLFTLILKTLYPVGQRLHTMIMSLLGPRRHFGLQGLGKFFRILLGYHPFGLEQIEEHRCFRRQ